MSEPFNVGCFLAGLVLMVAIAIAKPEQLRAPPGWFFEGVRPDGETTLRHEPPPGCGEPRPPHDNPCPDDGRAITTRIYCTGGATPVLVDGDRVVGCQRRFQ